MGDFDQAAKRTNPGELVGGDVSRPGKGTLVTGLQRHTTPREELGDRVQDAATAYQLAIGQVQLDTALSGEDDLPWFVGLLLDLAAGRLASIGKAAEAAEGAAKASAAVTWAAKSTLDIAKKIASAELKGSRRVAKGAYLKVLRDEIHIAYAALREDLKAGSDAEVAAAHAAFDPRHHSPSAYEGALREKLARFVASGVRKIGTSEPRRLSAHQMSEGVMRARETRVVRVVGTSGRRWYAFENRNVVITHGSVTASDPAQFGADIPDEFISTALELHAKIWRTDPEVRNVDDLQYLPRLDLGST